MKENKQIDMQMIKKGEFEQQAEIEANRKNLTEKDKKGILKMIEKQKTKRFYQERSFEFWACVYVGNKQRAKEIRLLTK